MESHGTSSQSLDGFCRKLACLSEPRHFSGQGRRWGRRAGGSRALKHWFLFKYSFNKRLFVKEPCVIGTHRPKHWDPGPLYLPCPQLPHHCSHGLGRCCRGTGLQEGASGHHMQLPMFDRFYLAKFICFWRLPAAPVVYHRDESALKEFDFQNFFYVTLFAFTTANMFLSVYSVSSHCDNTCDVLSWPSPF